MSTSQQFSQSKILLTLSYAFVKSSVAILLRPLLTVALTSMKVVTAEIPFSNPISREWMGTTLVKIDVITASTIFLRHDSMHRGL